MVGGWRVGGVVDGGGMGAWEGMGGAGKDLETSNWMNSFPPC